MRYRLHLELAEIKPVIWRKVWVEGQMRLRQLHHIIQAAMGWTSSHLHEFNITNTRYGVPDPDESFDQGLIDDRNLSLDQILTVGLRFEYVYDYGDNWVHLAQVDEA